MVHNIGSLGGVLQSGAPTHQQVYLAVHGAAKKRSVKHIKKSKVAVRPHAPQKAHGKHKAKKGHVKHVKKAPAKHKLKKGHVKHVKTGKAKHVPRPKPAKHSKGKHKKHKVTKHSHSKVHTVPARPTPPAPPVVYPIESAGFSMVGLHNAGGSCYLNTILQTLKHIPRFCDYLVTHSPTVVPTRAQFETACAANLANRATPAEQQVIRDWLIGCLRALFVQLDALPAGSALPPQFSNNIRHFFVLAGFGRPGAGGVAPNPETAQMDGGEFIQDLLRFINYPMMRVRKHTEYRVAGSTDVAQVTEDTDSLTLDIPINSNQPFAQHITGLNSVVPLSNLAPTVVRPPSFTGKTECTQTVSTSLVCDDPLHPPALLPVRLGRFTYTAPIQKISDRLDVPQRITVPIAGSTVTATYELCSVAVHRGSPNGGHYVACVPGGSGRWYTFDDGRVVPHPDRTAVTALVDNGGYVLCYQLV